DLDPLDTHRVEPEVARLCGGALRDIRRLRLEPVIDDHGTRPHPGSRRFERRRGGERERIRPARERDEDDRLGLGVARPPGQWMEGAPHRTPEVGDRGRQSGPDGHRLTLLRHPPTLPRSPHMAVYDAVIEIPRGSHVKYE